MILSRCFDKPNPEEIEKTVQEIELNLEELPGRYRNLYYQKEQ